jgi:hypothetical protein
MRRSIGINIPSKALRMDNDILSKTLSKYNNINYKLITIAFRRFQDKFLYIGLSDNRSIKDYHRNLIKLYEKFITNPTNNKSFSSLKGYHKSKTYIRSRSKTCKSIHDRLNRGDKNEDRISKRIFCRKNQK